MSQGAAMLGSLEAGVIHTYPLPSSLAGGSSLVFSCNKTPQAGHFIKKTDLLPTVLAGWILSCDWFVPGLPFSTVLEFQDMVFTESSTAKDYSSFSSPSLWERNRGLAWQGGQGAELRIVLEAFIV